MAANAFFQEEGKVYWRCCCCGKKTCVTMGALTDVCYIQVNNQTIGTSCSTCLPGITLRIQNLFNHRLQEVA